MNEKNLTMKGKNRCLSTEEAQRIGSIGGKKSAEARRRKKTLKEELLLILEDDDVQKRIATSLVNEAINGNKSGSCTRAFETIRDTIGEKESDKVDLNGGMAFYLEGISDEVSG